MRTKLHKYSTVKDILKYIKERLETNKGFFICIELYSINANTWDEEKQVPQEKLKEVKKYLFKNRPSKKVNNKFFESPLFNQKGNTSSWWNIHSITLQISTSKEVQKYKQKKQKIRKEKVKFLNHIINKL